MSEPLFTPSGPTALSAEHDALLGLFTEVNALAIQLKKAASLQPEGEVAAARRNILQVLARRGPLTVPRIARLRATSRQNTQILVNRLVEEGCLELQPNPDHKRSALVQLTGQGKALLETTTEQEAKLLADLLPHLAQAEVRATTELLGRLRCWLAGKGWEPAPVANGRKAAKLVSWAEETDQPPITPPSPAPHSLEVMPPMPVEAPSQESDLPVSLL